MVGTTLLRPSQKALRQAAELGCEMARSERRLKPDIGRAHSYETYHQFRNAHREQLERSDVFVRVWLERLFALADKEGRRLGLRVDDSMDSWDLWYNQVVVPMKNLAWETWEHSWDLPARYAEASHPEAAELNLSPAVQVLHAYSSLLNELKPHPVADEVLTDLA